MQKFQIGHAVRRNVLIGIASLAGALVSCGKTGFSSKKQEVKLKPLSAPATGVNNQGSVIQNVKVQVDGGHLGSESPVKVDFDVLRPEQLKEVQVEWRTGEGAWQPVSPFTRTATGVEFKYGNRNLGSFEIRIVGIQKESVFPNSEAIGSWTPNVFQSAVVTRTVQCLFCHLKVEGDVGGIEFPINTHEASGSGLTILGRLYSTNDIPAVLKGLAKGGDVPQYKNSEKPIFPTNLEFPTITSSLIETKMSGSLKGGKIVSRVGTNSSPLSEIVKVHKGNIILDGRTSPLELSGEVFVDGDVVIAGTYKGIGTLYARNIFVVGDLVAERSPFPFPVIESEAKDAAKLALKSGSDALYLAAIQDVVVGDPDHMFQGNESINKIRTNTPFLPAGWISKAEFLALGKAPVPAKEFKLASGGAPTWNPYGKDSLIHRIEVSRIDAYVFGGRAFLWHSAANSLLNGGYMSPHSIVLSRSQKASGSWWNCPIPAGQTKNKRDLPGEIPTACGKAPELINPRNGLPTHTNVIRFDYRLSVGIPGLDSLKPFFAN